MQDNRKNPPKKLRKNERREDMHIIRTSVSQSEIYVWALCLCFIVSMLIGFVMYTLIS